MRTSLFCIPLLLILAAPVSDPTGDGVKLYAQGKFKAAAEAFRRALTRRPTDPKLSYNLALALYRSGDLDGAEAAAEKAAVDADGAFDSLRDGILGNLRYDQAKAVAATAKKDPQKEVEVLEQAVQLAGTSRGHFESAALAETKAGRGAELVRNLERAIKLEAALKKQLEDAKKRREEQKKKDEQNKKKNQKDPKQKQDDKKDEQKPDEQKQDPDKKDEKPDEKEKDEKKDKPDENQKPEQKKDEKKEQQSDEEKENKPHEAPKPEEVPGELDPNKRLTPEQRRQLLKKLEDAEQKLRVIRDARKARRPKVKKDW